MPRALSSYGFDDSTGLSAFVVDDPAFVDAAIARITEDIELVTYAYALDAGEEVIDLASVRRAYELILSRGEFRLPLESPTWMRDSSRHLVRDLARAPLGYTDEANEAVSDLVGGAVFMLLASGAENANREEGSRRIRTRHYLPLCESWPYPLNRFC
jgi:hypothetical protein